MCIEGMVPIVGMKNSRRWRRSTPMNMHSYTYTAGLYSLLTVPKKLNAKEHGDVFFCYALIDP
jgi:hypothetical protein